LSAVPEASVKRRNALLNLLRSSHPEPVLAVTAASGLLAVSAGRGWSTAWVVTAVLAGQLFVGWTNDYLDRDLDARAGRAQKPVAAGAVPAQRVRTAAIVALIACVPLSLANGLAPGLLHLAAVGVATLYNLGVKSTPFSVIPYLLCFGAVPAFITLGLHPPHLPPAWATAAASLLGAGAHFTQVLPDIEEDRRLGVNGLPQRLGTSGSTLTAAVLLALSALFVLLGPGHPAQLQLAALAVTLGVIGGVILGGLSGRHRLAFRLTLMAAAGIAGLFLLSGRSLA
jgi:4-hydroxybenzoate polyprenyltransferase